MALHLSTMNDDVAFPTGLTVEPVLDNVGLRQWIDAWGCGAPESARQTWFDVYSTLGLEPEQPWMESSCRSAERYSWNVT